VSRYKLIGDRAKGESRDRSSTAGASAASIADPVSVGIAGFAVTTFALSRVNAGFFGGTAEDTDGPELAMFYGGLVRLLAGPGPPGRRIPRPRTARLPKYIVLRYISSGAGDGACEPLNDGVARRRTPAAAK
jgi:GPR1/FUN34/yaaH family